MAVLPPLPADNCARTAPTGGGLSKSMQECVASLSWARSLRLQEMIQAMGFNVTVIPWLRRRTVLSLMSEQRFTSPLKCCRKLHPGKRATIPEKL